VKVVLLFEKRLKNLCKYKLCILRRGSYII
jgi:hypothetical protein